MVSFKRKNNINALRVVMKIVATILALWVGGFTYNIVADVMNATSSPLYRGLTLVGFNVQTVANTTSFDNCVAHSCTGDSCSATFNCLVGTNSTSLLAVLGIVAIFWIAFEFIQLKF